MKNKFSHDRLCADGSRAVGYERNAGLVCMIQEGKMAVVDRAKPAKTISPVKARTTGTVPAETESVGSAVVSDGVCRTVTKQQPLLIKAQKLTVSQAVTLNAVSCRTENLSMQRANCIEGSGEWNLETLFRQAGGKS